ncbi:Tetratricopeptide-like helical [Cordyceps fumosorosea ARSEF 2679]|uniref:Tetratricopeptide-like helical n=1 Tax=Cordyceps fumosorosea (strain ARSEF 2679) TaxID=1081104 RepID=A0A168E0E5_CORFA|nr:Tetratricopeptide-like helical [Cordyceps fumosorosea ARSEF 2679]OAA73227.1 Tetratricopeptide-like helical [Cordyceps fumosorosea ARSEF 2679]
MGLRDKLMKRDGSGSPEPKAPSTDRGNIIGQNGYAPEFTFIRSDTASMEVIHPGNGGSTTSASVPAPHDDGGHLSPTKEPSTGLRRSLSIFHSSRSRSASVSSQVSQQSSSKEGSGSRRRRLSERLHLRHHQVASSDSVPDNLPAIVVAGDDKDTLESQWEQRATLLAVQNELARSASGSPGVGGSTASLSIRPRSSSSQTSSPAAAAGGRIRSRSLSPGMVATNTTTEPPPLPKAVSSKKIDDDIQEAIRLHEEGDLQRSTAIFGRLADTEGANNPLSQVLFGHGWGCEPDTARAGQYLSAAATNSAKIEDMALKAGMQKGGAAKGELILAMFELGNCFRHGWGMRKDPEAAKEFYETAANLGDTDAMNETAWCYLNGFGCDKKDKFQAAKYYRRAENAGNKTLGNSWIWKEKYDPDKQKPDKQEKKK